MATLFRPPLLQRIAVKSALVALLAQSGVQANLLTTTLKDKDRVFAGAGQTKTYDYPNPMGKAFPSDLRTFVDPSEYWLLKDTFFGAAGQPPANLDWPVPQAKPAARDLRTHVDPSEFWMLTDRLYGAPGEAPAYDYPNPRSVAPVVTLRTWTQSLNTTTLALAATTPFTETEWAIPSRRPEPVNLRTVADGTEFWLLADQFFSAPGQAPVYQWPLPIRVPSPAPLTWAPPALTLTTLAPVTAAPFAASDWPVPRLAPSALRIGHYRPTSAVPSAALAAAPVFGATDPVPAQRPTLSALRTYVQGSAHWLLTDTFFGAVGQPVANTDWPIPQAKRAASDLLTYVDSGEFWLLAPAAAAAPFTETDWPIPARRPEPVDLRTVADGSEFWLLQDQFFGAAGQPPTPVAWPLPRVAPSIVDLRSASVSSAIGLLTAAPVAAPFRPVEWPIPSRAVASPITSRTFLFYYILDDSVPFTIELWPLPARRVRRELGAVTGMPSALRASTSTFKAAWARGSNVVIAPIRTAS